MGRAEGRSRRRSGAPVPRILLTGGIATGKTTVARLFETLGARIIDTDQIAREVVVPGTAGLASIVQRFGPGILDAAGALDRGKLRDIVFRDAQARADLEAITHPAIRAEVAARSAAPGAPYQLIAIPVLHEKPPRSDYARVLVVDCEPAIQLRRLMLRDRIDEAAARRMIEAQIPREARLALADDVIHNDGDVSMVASQVEALHKAYLDPQGYAK